LALITGKVGVNRNSVRCQSGSNKTDKIAAVYYPPRRALLQMRVFISRPVSSNYLFPYPPVCVCVRESKLIEQTLRQIKTTSSAEKLQLQCQAQDEKEKAILSPGRKLAAHQF